MALENAKIFDTRIQMKKDTSANWTQYNPVLLDGEEILVVTSSGEIRRKIGDGVKTYTQLPFTDENLRALISEQDINMKDGAGENSLVGNDIDNNNAISAYSTALGNGTIAGSKGFRIGAIDHESNSITLQGYSEYVAEHPDNVLAIDDVYTMRLNDNYDKQGVITGIYGDVITVTNLPEADIVTDTDVLGDINTFRVIEKPFTGNIDVATVAIATGIETKAVGSFSFAEGYGTEAYGKYSHAEGKLNKAGYSAHAEGEETEAIGMKSHTEGNLTKAIGYDSHAEGAKTKAIGNRAHAEGLESEAIGSASHAEGRNTKASGLYAHAEGENTTASGYNSHAEGYNTIAFNNTAHAEGNFTTASGESSHAEGTNTKATHKNAHAEGLETEASGQNSHAEGNKTIASGWASHTEGENSTAENSYAHAEGHGTHAVGIGSHSEGKSSTASGEYSHAEGEGNTASGYSSHSEGRDTEATYEFAHAEGKGSSASGSGSHAEGRDTEATALASHAEGRSTSANGQASHAEGYSTFANGYASHSEGQGSIATETNQHVQGAYNYVERNEDGSIKTAGNYAHIVGGGTSDNNRKNIHTVDWNGNAWFAGNITVGLDNKQVLTSGTISEGEGVKSLLGNNTSSNNAVSEYSTALGDNTIAGSRGFRIIASSGTSGKEGTYTLENYTGGYEVGDEYSLRITNMYDRQGHITGINGNVITVDNYADEELASPDVNECYISGKWTWKDNLDSIYLEEENVNFTSDGYSFDSICAEPGTYFLNYKNSVDDSNYFAYSGYDENNDSNYDGWYVKDYNAWGRIIDFGTESQKVSKQFYECITTYAEPENENQITLTYQDLLDKNSFRVEAKPFIGNIDIGKNSFAIGIETQALGYNSFAEGYGSIAFGKYSHAEGRETFAAYSSHSEGRNTKAKGVASHAGGLYTIAEKDYQTVVGKYNKIDSDNKYAYIVGNGTAENDRKNAFAVGWDNSITIGNTTITEDQLKKLLTLLEYTEYTGGTI